MLNISTETGFGTNSSKQHFEGCMLIWVTKRALKDNSRCFPEFKNTNQSFLKGTDGRIEKIE
jgi:hypothetical protein